MGDLFLFVLAIVDQIVLSPDTYVSTAPGPNDNDTTILPAKSGG